MAYLEFRSLCLIIAMRRSGRGPGGVWSRTTLDLRSLSLIGAMRRVGGGAGRRMVLYNLRFTLTEPHRRHAAWRHSRRGRGGGDAGGEGGRGVRGKDMHALYFKF